MVLDAFIIEEIRRREEEKRRRQEDQRPRIHIDIPLPPGYPSDTPGLDDIPFHRRDDDGTGGVVIIPYDNPPDPNLINLRSHY